MWIIIAWCIYWLDKADNKVFDIPCVFSITITVRLLKYIYYCHFEVPNYGSPTFFGST